MPRPLVRAAVLAACLALSACATTPDPPPGADAVAAGPVESPPDAAGATPPAVAGDAPADIAGSGDPIAGAGGDAPAAPAPTQAELDYAALYGDSPYDPVADATLPSPAEVPASYDPWEPLNRRMHKVNKAIDRAVARPLAQAYTAVVPRPVRIGVGNFFRNLGQPVTALNSLLQGKPKQAGQALGRFALNTTLGLAGFLDPASSAGIPLHNEDFGQTLGVWGWERSRYVELPLFGPRTIRDVVGMAGDSPLAPLRQVEEDRVRVFFQGLQLVDVRTQLFAVDGMLEGAPDEYALLRDAWLQRRNYQIQGDRSLEDDEDLPDYLREVENPTVPIDAMPVIPDGG
ncbi:VacJ family lipoprotein [Luteimonas pelagia]